MLNYSQPKKDTMVKVYEFLNQILKDGATCYTNVYSGESEISELLENKMLNYFTFSYDGVHWFHITMGSWTYEVSLSIQYKPSNPIVEKIKLHDDELKQHDRDIMALKSRRQK